jgi:hypothetical protein
MGSKRCRLYDENLVHNIMLSTGLSVFECLRENAAMDSDEICFYIEENAEAIISDTIRQLKEEGDPLDKEDGFPDDDPDEWPPPRDSE